MPPRFCLDIWSLYWNEFRDVSTRPQSFPICRQNHPWDHPPPQMPVVIPWLWHQSRFAVHQCLRLALSSLQVPQRVRQLWWPGERPGLPRAEENALDSFSALLGVSRCYRRADRQYPVKNISQYMLNIQEWSTGHTFNSAYLETFLSFCSGLLIVLWYNGCADIDFFCRSASILSLVFYFSPDSLLLRITRFTVVSSKFGNSL